MKTILGKMAPTALILILTAYCAYSLPDELKAEKDGKAQPAVLAMLKAAMTPDPSRDPFGLKDEAPAKGKDKAKTVPGALAAVKAKVEKPVRLESQEVAGLARGLSLKATCASPNGGTAIINGKFYSKGDTVKGTGALALLLDEVFEDHVVLRQGDQTTELKFLTELAKGAHPKGAKTAKAGAARPGAPKGKL
jgi:hypothetical protein